jgi:arylsulfatase A
MKQYLLAMLMVFPASCWVPTVGYAQTSPPNVVLFYADDFGWGDIHRHNTNPEHFRYTPNLDRLFDEGIEFKNYMTHAVCSPSRAGLLTGKHYAKVGAGPRTGGTLPNDIRNMAKDFQAAGYKTGAFGKWHNSLPNFPAQGNGARVDYNQAGKWHALHGEKTLDLTNNIFENHKGWKWGQGVNAYGFDRWVGYYNGGGDFFDRYVNWHHDVDWWHDRNYRGDETGYTTDLITQYAIEFIEAYKTEPFFCYIPQEAVHNPLHLKRSDLQEFCRKLGTELGIKGQWEYVSNIVSPKTGRRLGDVDELRCERGQEFDVYEIDPEQRHYAHLAYAAFIYSLDKRIGAVIEKVTQIGKMKNTLFFFASDNGATPKGVNTPFRGGKHSLWEGGVHVPAALWWPGTFDKNTAPYSPAHNSYDGLIAYIDIYPTLLSMCGQPCLGTELDGLDCWSYLQTRHACRPETMNDPVFWMWLDYGSVRTNKWKLHYSESQDRVELYDIQVDIEESHNLASSQTRIANTLIERYRAWINENNYTLSYMTIDKANISHPDPAPAGEVLEVRATQSRAIKHSDRDGVFVRFSNGSGWDQEYDAYVHPGDRVEFDIFVCPDSDVVKGCYYNPGNGWNPFYKSKNGLNQDGVALTELELPQGVWTRQVVGIGNYCPGSVSVNYIALQSASPGVYHYYLDNVVIRKKDGGIRSVIWQSNADFAPLLYRYKGVNHSQFKKAQNASGFPFTDVQLTAYTLGSRK